VVAGAITVTNNGNRNVSLGLAATVRGDITTNNGSITLAQNARTSGGGNITMVPKQAVTVGPKETWRAEKVSIWHAGTHDNPLGQRLTALMISKRFVDASTPMSLLADHPNVQFNYYRGGLGSCAVEMH
jgi:glucosamine-6-phosphate deaminase